MAKGSREANILVKVDGADKSKQELGKIRQGFEDIGDDGKKAAQRAVDALESIEKADDRLTKKISQGKAVTARDVAGMGQSFREFEKIIIQLFGSVDKAPAHIQESFSKASQTLEGAKGKVRELTDATQEQNRELGEGGERWDGLSNAMNKALGPAGAIQAKIGLIGAAFSGGWAEGMKLNKIFGTDMSLWEEAVGNFGARVGAILRAISDNVVAVMNLIKATFNRDWTEMKLAWAEIDETGNKLRTTLVDGGKAAAAASAAVAEKMQAQAEASKVAAEAAKKLADEQEKLRQKLSEVVAALQAETAELEKQKLIAQDAGLRLVDRSNQLSYYERQLRDATAAVAAQGAEVAKLTAVHGAQDPVTLAAIERQAGLEASLKYTKASYDGTSTEVKKYEGQQRAATAAIEASETKLGSLYEKQKELTGGTTKLSEAQTGVVTSSNATAVAMEKVGTAAATAATEVSNVGKAINDIKALTAVIKELNQVISETTNNASLAAAAIYGMSQAGLEGGGDEEPS